MSDDMQTYDGAVEASESALGEPSHFGPLDVRYIEGTSHGHLTRTTYTHLVVNHDTEEILHIGRPAREGDANPSPEAEAARAEGIAAGWLLGHPDHEW